MIEKTIEKTKYKPGSIPEKELIVMCDNINAANQKSDGVEQDMVMLPRCTAIRQAKMIVSLVTSNKEKDKLITAYRAKDPKARKILLGESDIVIAGKNGPKPKDAHLSRDTATDIVRGKKQSDKRKLKYKG